VPAHFEPVDAARENDLTAAHATKGAEPVRGLGDNADVGDDIGAEQRTGRSRVDEHVDLDLFPTVEDGCRHE